LLELVDAEEEGLARGRGVPGERGIGAQRVERRDRAAALAGQLIVELAERSWPRGEERHPPCLPARKRAIRDHGDETGTDERRLAAPRRTADHEHRVAPEPAHELVDEGLAAEEVVDVLDRKSTRLNSSHVSISYAVFCLKK